MLLNMYFRFRVRMHNQERARSKRENANKLTLLIEPIFDGDGHKIGDLSRVYCRPYYLPMEALYSDISWEL